MYKRSEKRRKMKKKMKKKILNDINQFCTQYAHQLNTKLMELVCFSFIFCCFCACSLSISWSTVLRQWANAHWLLLLTYPHIYQANSWLCSLVKLLLTTIYIMIKVSDMAAVLSPLYLPSRQQRYSMHFKSFKLGIVNHTENACDLTEGNEYFW